MYVRSIVQESSQERDPHWVEAEFREIFPEIWALRERAKISRNLGFDAALRAFARSEENFRFRKWCREPPALGKFSRVRRVFSLLDAMFGEGARQNETQNFAKFGRFLAK